MARNFGLRSGWALAGLGLNRVFQSTRSLAWDRMPSAGYMTGEPEAHGLGWDQRYLSGKKRRRADATAEVNLVGLGSAWANFVAPGQLEARAPRALVHTQHHMCTLSYRSHGPLKHCHVARFFLLFDVC
jgi:hypothetical protein